MSRSLQSNIVRGCIAGILLACLAAFVGNSLFPDMPTWGVLLYVLVGGAAAFAAVLAATAGSLQFRQWILRNGGTDTQWFWFSSEPEGLRKLREEARSAEAPTPEETDPTRHAGGRIPAAEPTR